jgi:pantoate--beta-alanine ligase
MAGRSESLGIDLIGQRKDIRLIEDIEEMRAVSLDARKTGARIVLVPTMGGLHRGHMELIRRGRALGELLIVSIFVNPKQFGPGEDISTYPGDLAGDMEKASQAGADIVFHPGAGALYPDGYQSFVEVGENGGVSSNLCGLSRPGHFRGVATVVTKLFNITAPDTAVFGLKDFQQYRVIKRLSEELNTGVVIVGVDTVREPDGLALSSRNSYLTPSQREAAKVVPACLKAGVALFEKGCKKSVEIIEEVKKNIENEPQAVIDYVVVCDSESLNNIENIDKGALLAVAIRIGKARLIDNALLGIDRQI